MSKKCLVLVLALSTCRGAACQVNLRSDSDGLHVQDLRQIKAAYTLTGVSIFRRGDATHLSSRWGREAATLLEGDQDVSGSLWLAWDQVTSDLVWPEGLAFDVARLRYFIASRVERSWGDTQGNASARTLCAIAVANRERRRDISAWCRVVALSRVALRGRSKGVAEAGLEILERGRIPNDVLDLTFSSSWISSMRERSWSQLEVLANRGPEGSKIRHITEFVTSLAAGEARAHPVLAEEEPWMDRLGGESERVLETLRDVDYQSADGVWRLEVARMVLRGDQRGRNLIREWLQGTMSADAWRAAPFESIRELQDCVAYRDPENANAWIDFIRGQESWCDAFEMEGGQPVRMSVIDPQAWQAIWASVGAALERGDWSLARLKIIQVRQILEHAGPLWWEIRAASQ